MMQGGDVCEETGASRSLKTVITCCATNLLEADGQATSPTAILVSIQVRKRTLSDSEADRARQERNARAVRPVLHCLYLWFSLTMLSLLLLRPHRCGDTIQHKQQAKGAEADCICWTLILLDIASRRHSLFYQLFLKCLSPPSPLRLHRKSRCVLISLRSVPAWCAPQSQTKWSMARERKQRFQAGLRCRVLGTSSAVFSAF